MSATDTSALMRTVLLAALPVLLPGQVLVAAPRSAQEPADAALKRTVLDLRYSVVDLKIASSDTAGSGSTLAGKVEALAVKETPTEIRIELAADVLFDFDKADIRSEAAAALRNAADILRQKAKGPVRVEGHTDAKGADAYNQNLSVRRAEAVRAWLVEKEGLKGLSFTTRGFGSKNPVAPNTTSTGADNPAGRQKNRRVEIIAGK
jgi:outer membrane protein OmpA-like peptidoglycan-associated protein